MIGAIVGDIVGSVYEWNNVKSKEFPLFREDCHFTDDTVMTIAVAEALLEGGEREQFVDCMKRYGRMYPKADYGGRFYQWLQSEDREPYGSWGNGSAMRVSPVGEMVLPNWRESQRARWMNTMPKRSAEVTHNHPEGMKGAWAVAECIACLRYYPYTSMEKAKADIKRRVEEKTGYHLSRTLDEIRPGYTFQVSCQQSVPEAIIAFLESTDFEDAIRNAISLGGDSDTIACMTGSIAEAAYGVPDWIREKALTYLDAPLKAVVERWERRTQ